jgi:small subunit ribosomal protein S8
MMTDPIADLLTRLRNAQAAHRDTTMIPYSRVKENILRVINNEGYVRTYEVIGEGTRKQLVVTLKYTRSNEPVISGLKRISKPGRRVYRGCDDLDDLKPGMGCTIISTPRGVMTDKAARESHAGGEVICQIW